MKSWDVTIIGAGIVGLSLAIALRKQGLTVLIVERGEPGREASYAAAGMLAPIGPEIPPALAALAAKSASMYSEFVHEVSDESGVKIDFREEGTILISNEADIPKKAERLTPAQLSSLEPEVKIEPQERHSIPQRPETTRLAFLRENSVDPRTLMAALIKAAKHRDVDISSGTQVKTLLMDNDRTSGVHTDKSSYGSGIVVNCAGAWAGHIAPQAFPVRPVKGQMLSLVGGPTLRHVIRSKDGYIVPRSDGRVVIGSTLEEAGFNKQVDLATIEKLLRFATSLVPRLAESRQHEAWAGLRPGTPDNLPILGETRIPGYFIASGHYRDGILLAPATAEAMADVIAGKTGDSIADFSPKRFL